MGIPGIDNGADRTAGIGDVVGLELAGSGVFIGGASNGTTGTGGNGSVRIRRKLLLRASIAIRAGGTKEGDCGGKGSVAPDGIEPGTGLMNCGRDLVGCDGECAAGRTMRSG